MPHHDNDENGIPEGAVFTPFPAWWRQMIADQATARQSFINDAGSDPDNAEEREKGVEAQFLDFPSGYRRIVTNPTATTTERAARARELAEEAKDDWLGQLSRQQVTVLWLLCGSVAGGLTVIAAFALGVWLGWLRVTA